MKEKKMSESVRDWRWVIGVCVLAYALMVIAISSLSVISGKQLLQGLGVAAMDHPLMDLHAVAAWCDAANEGKDPFVVETWIKLPGANELKLNFLMNYSPAVLLLGKFGLSGHSVIGWGMGLGVLYIISIGMLSGSCSLRRAIFWAGLACSPVSVLAVERGNLDMLLFALLFLALLLRKHPWAELLMIFGAASAKFFPIASLIAPWKGGTKNAHLIVLATGLLFLFFLVTLHSHLAMIVGSLSGQFQSAFGSTTIADLLVHNGLHSSGGVGRLRLILKLAAFIGLSCGFLTGLCLRRPPASGLPTERSLHAFFLTAPMMLVLFVLGPQMDYKWIFFLFMVPAGLELIHSSCQQEALVAKAWLAAITLYSYWTFFSDEGSLRNALLKQVVMWCAMLLSAFLAGALWNRKTSP